MCKPDQAVYYPLCANPTDKKGVGGKALLIQITDLIEAKRIHAKGFTGIISIADPWAETLVLEKNSGADHLELRFVDLDQPLEAGEPRRDMVMPTAAMVEQALDFAARHAQTRLLIHCHAGVSRSTAIGLAIYAARLGAGAEEQSLDALLETVPDAVPNLAVVAIADNLLQRSGNLLSTIVRWDAATPRNHLRRGVNRRAYQEIFLRPR